VQSPTTQSAIQEVTFENQSTQPRSDQSTQAQARQSRSTTSLECDKRDTYFLLRWKVSDRKLGKIIPSDVNTEDERPVLILRQITFWLSGASPSIDDHPIFTMSEDREWTGEINRRLPKQPWASVAFSIGVLERLAQETRAKDTRPTPPGGQNFRSLAHIIVER